MILNSVWFDGYSDDNMHDVPHLHGDNEEARKVVETLYKATIDEVNKITEKSTNEIEDGAENQTYNLIQYHYL